MPPVSTDFFADDLIAFLPGQTDCHLPFTLSAEEADPSQLLGKVLQFDLVDLASAESLLWPRGK